MGSRLEVVYFDQRREVLDPNKTPWQTLCPNGGQTVETRGRSQHVIGYLRSFLFEEHQAQSPVSSLSGGEQNRLLLARLFARPGNLLALDMEVLAEIRKDLDIEAEAEAEAEKN